MTALEGDDLPGPLRRGVEALSGVSLDGVQVHRNSERPARLAAHAFAQGEDIHFASGQERHTPHGAWHVVEQRQRRVAPQIAIAGEGGIDDSLSLSLSLSLEVQANVLGERADRGSV